MIQLSVYTHAIILATCLSIQLQPSISFQPPNPQTLSLRAPFRLPVIQSTYSSEIQDPKTASHNRPHDVSLPKPHPRTLNPTEIRNKPPGSLDQHQLKSLCNSIRFVNENSVFKSLHVLERILLEIKARDLKNDMDSSTPVLLKSIHVFSVLTSLSRETRKLDHRKKKCSQHGKIDARVVRRLQNVVMLLRQLSTEKSMYLGEGCYNEDVVSFAIMISADIAKMEMSGVDASLKFLQWMEEDDKGGVGDTDSEWDPRLIGAVLNGLAVWGRAEEAQSVLENAMGINMLNASAGEFPGTSRRRLKPSEAEPCYNALLRAYSKHATMLSQKKRDESTLAKSKAALAKCNLILLHHMPNVPELPISNRTCLAALQGYGALGLGQDAEELLAKIEIMLQSTNTSPQSDQDVSSNLDSACYNSVIDGMTRGKQLESMVNHSACYNSVLDAHCQSQHEDGIARAEELFHSMVNQEPIAISNSSLVEILPPRADFISYMTMLNTYSKRGLTNEADALLKAMISASKTDETAPLPTAASYLSVIRAFEKSNDDRIPERIMSLLADMEQLHKEDQGSSNLRKQPMPTRGIYISALKYMSKLGRAIEAEQLFNKLRNTNPWSKSWTDIQACTLVLRAWGWTDQVTRAKAATRAAALLSDLESHVEKGHLKPLDVNLYNIVLNCYAKAGLDREARALLNNMQPNGISYGLLIKAISKANMPDAVDRAWRVLEKLGFNSKTRSKKLSSVFDDSIEPFNSMLRLLAKRGLATEAESLLNMMDEMYYDRLLNFRPNVHSYEAVLEALGRCKELDSVIRAEALLTRMDVLQELGGTMEPSLMAFNHLINCYGNAGMSGRAERLLDRLINEVDTIKPDEYTIGSTIKAIINGRKSQENALTRVSSLVEAGSVNNRVISTHQLKLYTKFGVGHEAEALLRRIVKPGIIHYTIVLDSWAKSEYAGALSRAEALFAEMETHPDFQLDIAAYNSMMLNYSTRSEVQKAEKLMERILLDPSVSVNRKTFTILINTYGNNPLKTLNAGKRAEELLDKMREFHATGNNDAEPDDVTYRSVVKCIRNGLVHDITEHEKLALKL
ncbi:hypothetical protein ACHAWO_003385, partial [Cyclotella atomus]